MENSWATHYKFIKFGQFSEHFVPKAGLETWFDLKYDLNDYVEINHQCIDIVINNKRVFYDNKTLLQDIDIKPDDVCFVIAKPRFDKNIPDQLAKNNQYILKAQTSIQQNRVKIQNKNSHPLFKTSLQRIQASLELKSIYKNIVKEFSQWESIVAFHQCQGKEDTIRQYLLEGKARPTLARITNQQQKEQIDNFLKLKEIQQLKEQVFSQDKSLQTYGNIMRQLYLKYPYFKELELKHQAYIQRRLLNRQLYPFYNIQLQDKVKKILAAVESQRHGKNITSQQLQTFRNGQLKAYKVDDIESAISQSGKNLKHAVQLLKGKVDNSKNLIMCLKKSSRLNLILQFFSQPTFQKVRSSLIGNKNKCEAFINFVISSSKSHTYLVSLIKKYRPYVITILSNIYSLEQEVSSQRSDLLYQQQLTEQEQRHQRAIIQDKLDYQLVGYLKKCGVQQKLAVSAVRAAQNQVQKVQIYLTLGGINRKYDFCIPKLEQEQKYLQNYFKKDKDTLVKLKDKQFQTLWLGSTLQTSSFLFQIIIRNKRFFDRFIAEAGKSK